MPRERTQGERLPWRTPTTKSFSPRSTITALGTSSGVLSANAKRAAAAIASLFGGTPPKFADADSLLDPHTIVQLGTAPVRIDILSKLGATRFQDAWKRRVNARYGGVSAHYLSLEDLIREKEHGRRTQDLADLEALRRVRPRRP
jgi:hypothetical protein